MLLGRVDSEFPEGQFLIYRRSKLYAQHPGKIGWRRKISAIRHVRRRNQPLSDRVILAGL